MKELIARLFKLTGGSRGQISIESQTVEKAVEGEAVLYTQKASIIQGALIDAHDDERREEMFKQEDYFFRVAPSYLKNKRYEELGELLERFIKFKMKDRELMLYYENLDDERRDLGYEKIEKGIETFGLEAWLCEQTLLKNKKKSISKNAHTL